MTCLVKAMFWKDFVSVGRKVGLQVFRMDTGEDSARDRDEGGGGLPIAARPVAGHSTTLTRQVVSHSTTLNALNGSGRLPHGAITIV